MAKANARGSFGTSAFISVGKIYVINDDHPSKKSHGHGFELVNWVISDTWRFLVGERQRLEKVLLRNVGRASIDFELIEPGDRVMVCMSGGKDSYVMLHLMRLIQRRVPFDFEFIAVNLDQGQPGFQGHILSNFFEAEGYPFKMISQNTFAIVTKKVPEGKTYCALCSRMRRGILYNAAVELNCTKIALGHHKDDIIETLMLNLLYSGQIKAMPPKLQSDDGRNIVIRPLAYCAERDIAAFAELMAFPILPCDLCGSQDGLQRQAVKGLLNHLNDVNPNVKGNLFAALSNVRPSHLLDTKLRKMAGVELWQGTDEHVL